MDKYYDYRILNESTKFVVHRLINEPNYNYFYDPAEKELFDQSWKHLIDNQNTDDFFQHLHNNRSRLVLLVFNYHLITPDNYYLRFDKEYISSKQYRSDVSEVIKEGITVSVNMAEEILKGTEYISQKGTIISAVSNLFSLSSLFSVPMPALSYMESQNLAEESPNIGKLITNRYTDNFFDTHFQVIPNPIEEVERGIDNESLQQKFINFRIDKDALLQQNVSLDQNFKLRENWDRHQVSNYNEFYSLLPAFVLSNLSLIQTGDLSWYNLSSTLCTNVLSISKSHQKDMICFQIEPCGIAKAYENKYDSNNLKFHELFNRIFHLLVKCNSRIGFAFDMESMLVIQIDLKNPSPTRIKSIDGSVKQLNFHMRCFKHSDSKYSIASIFMILTSFYFNNVQKKDRHSIQNLSNALLSNAADKEENDMWVLDFFKQERESNLSNYIQSSTGSYVHRDYPMIIIPRGTFEVIKDIRFKFQTLMPTCFTIIGNERKTVLKSDFCIESTKRSYKVVYGVSNVPMVLKTYNVSYITLRGLLSRRLFLKKYKSTLNSFLLEVCAFLKLQDRRKTDLTNLYQYGFINDSSPNRLGWFYLLERHMEKESKEPIILLGSVHKQNFYDRDLVLSKDLIGQLNRTHSKFLTKTSIRGKSLLAIYRHLRKPKSS
ncbi:uncharacterized protein RJT21DRAFT_118209, partial [Scheffersomyces amazonensis]|uniref:uncharacterized protein n=1 Tax=Scheffersomyces amazonensis TaxID=1078765 RepID=UPI00315D7434